MELLVRCMMACVPFGFNLAMLCATFRNRRRFASKKFYLIILGGFVVAVLLTVVLELLKAASVWQLSYITAFCILTLLICKLLFHSAVKETLFSYFVIQSYIDDCFMISKMLQAYCLPHSVGETTGYFITYGLLLILGLPVIYLFVRKGLRPLVNVTERMNFWWYIWIVPLSFYLVYRLGISRDYLTPDLMWDHPEIAVPIIWMIATALSYILIVRMLVGVVKHVKDREQMEAMNQQLLMQKQQYQKLQTTIDETARVRHDMKHQMRALMGYTQRQDVEGMKRFLQQYIEELEAREELTLCENHAVDAVVQYYMRMANENGIHFSAELQLPSELPCGETDVCVILGNLLENALEACLRQKDGERRIKLQADRKKPSELVIIVQNCCKMDIKCRKGHFLSAKREFLKAGVGIPSVQKIAEKYDGVVKFEYDDHRFQVSVFLTAQLT